MPKAIGYGLLALLALVAIGAMGNIMGWFGDAAKTIRKEASLSTR